MGGWAEALLAAEKATAEVAAAAEKEEEAKEGVTGVDWTEAVEAEEGLAEEAMAEERLEEGAAGRLDSSQARQK